ncbi:MAG: preprotein translocase subunit YajC, partial [Opitutae bacterium]
ENRPAARLYNKRLPFFLCLIPSLALFQQFNNLGTYPAMDLTPLIILGQQPPSMAPQLLMIVFLFLGMWFLIIAPQRKKQKQQQKMIEALGSGDKVVTIGGFYGIVQSVKDDRVVIKIAEGTKVEVRKSAVEACLNKDS